MRHPLQKGRAAPSHGLLYLQGWSGGGRQEVLSCSVQVGWPDWEAVLAQGFEKGFDATRTSVPQLGFPFTGSVTTSKPPSPPRAPVFSPENWADTPSFKGSCKAQYKHPTDGSH